MRNLVAVLVVTALVSSCAQHPAKPPVAALGVTIFENGHVFDGENFKQRPICIASKAIVACPAMPERRVDLKGSYVTPPLGDVHTHHFDGPYALDWHTGLSLKSGVFYAMNMTARGSQVAKIRDRLSGPGNVDVSSSMGGITGPESHPAEIYEAIALGAYSYEDQLARMDDIRASRLVADDAYYVVETPADVLAKWSLLLATKPDHVKIFLRSSECYDEGCGKWGPGGGIDPKLVPQITQLSKSSGLRLAVATSSVADYRTALVAGADLVTHLPCYQDSSADPGSPYFDLDTEDECLISPVEAESVAEKGMITSLIVTEWAKSRSKDIVAWEMANIRTLQDAGAPLALGVDAYGETITQGLIAGVEKGFLTPAEALTIGTIDTPRAIFPDRAIGCLEVSCEASFIVFANNPLEDFNAIETLSFGIKDGQRLALE